MSNMVEKRRVEIPPCAPDAKQGERIATLEALLRQIGEDIAHIENKVDSLEALANKWRGGFIVVLVVGGLIGWFVDRLWSMWPGGGSGTPTP